MREGAKVALVDLPTSKGAAVVKELDSDRCIFVPADITKETDIKDALEEIKSKFKRLDTAVSCAGIGVAFKTYNFNKDAAHMLEDFTKVQMVNTVGTFNVIRLSAGLIGKNDPDIDGQRGVLINTASIAAYDGQMGQAAYAASKVNNQ